MSNYHDPLGIERLIDQAKELHKLNPLSEDLVSEWQNHPVTKRLKQHLQIDLYERLQNVSNPASNEVVELYNYLLSYPVLEAKE